MFTLSRDPLKPDQLQSPLRHPGAGAYVSFEGWVRDHNEGKRVHRLDYEAYEPMAVNEGGRIVQAAVERFGLTAAHCVHRVGKLAIGDLAVWVGVSSPHRGEAFKACRYIIDEVKHHVPIWKKELYTDGDSGWVNCEACAHGESHIAFTENDLYDRQTRVPMFGPEGQEKLRSSRVLVVGAGGLGAPVLLYLAAAGVGTLGVCDGDTLDVSNLHRQPIFDAADVGKPKAQLAANRIQALNPFITVRVHPQRITPLTAEVMLDDYDLVLDCTDNFETKYLLSDAAVLTKTPLIVASIYQFEGQLSRYVPGTKTPCMRCLWPEIPEPGCVGSCAEVGVLGVVPGVLGTLQAGEAIKHIVGLPGLLEDEILLVDCLSYDVRRVRARRAPQCPTCGDAPFVRDLDPDEYGGEDDVEMTPKTLKEQPETLLVLDIRDSQDIAASPIPGRPAVPANPELLFRQPARILNGQRCVICCERGVRSRTLALHLRRLGYANVYSLQGGTKALKA